MHIPGYKIEREIGRGGMAKVYLAVHELLGRPVALKVLLPELAADRAFSERFMQEARNLARLSHRNIVAIYDVCISDHDHYLALEYIDGGDLKSRVRRGALDPRAAMAIVREVAAALGYLHAKNFVHRDVKPENILFRENGMAVLTDFGIARTVEGGTRMTGMGMSIGTPHYMSPEQARGKTVDGRSDLYSLGIVFYEMLTGAVPYDAEEPLAIGIKHVAEPVPVLPPALRGYQTLIERMLAKDPNARYRTAEELVAAIDNHDPGAKPRASGPRRTVVMPAAAVTQAADAAVSPRRVSDSGTALKWAAIGGLAAIGSFAAFWVIQDQGTMRIAGGGGVPAAAPATQVSRVTNLEPALTKSTAAMPTVPAVPPIFAQPTPAKADPDNVEIAAWNGAEKTDTRDAYQSYLNAYPNGNFASLVPGRISKLDDATDAWGLAEQANSRDSYEGFLKAHPNSTYAELAKFRLKRLK